MNLKKGLIMFLFAGVIFLAAGKVYATATTHIWGPSTDVQAYKLWHLTNDYYVPTKVDASGNHIPTVTNLGLTVGVLPFKNYNLEIGFDHKTGLGTLDNYPMYFNTKFGIPEKAFGEYFPALAAGILDVGTKNNKTNNDVAYFKAAKSFSAGKFDLGRVSIGYFEGNKKLLFDQNGEKDNTGVLLAWERTLTEISDKWWICAEYMGSKSSYGTMNYGFSYKFAPNADVLVGYDIYNNKSLPDTATVQIDVDF